MQSYRCSKHGTELPEIKISSNFKDGKSEIEFSVPVCVECLKEKFANTIFLKGEFTEPTVRLDLAMESNVPNFAKEG
jgi:hypothetical protein